MSEPQIPYIDKASVDNAVSLWRSGQLVAFPTETVYGLGADATNGEAVAKIYNVKSRPQFNPLIVHVADIATAKGYVQWNDAAEILATKFWPGPLTLILPRRTDSGISDLVTAGGETIGIRMPSHPVARQLLAAFGGGIAAPSANRSGRVSPTTAAHVEEELGGAIPLIIDGGPCDVGLESTVIDITGPHPVLLRPGAITRAMLEQTLGQIFVEGASDGVLRAPGQLASHYAPALPVRLNVTELRKGDALLAFGPTQLTAPLMQNLSPRGDLLEAASNLFAALRTLDSADATAIAVMPIPEDGVGEAINDRLRRAAVR